VYSRSPLPLKRKKGGESVNKLHRKFKLIHKFKLTARFLHKMFACSLFLSAIIIIYFFYFGFVSRKSGEVKTKKTQKI